MDLLTLERMLRAGKIKPEEVLARASLDSLDDTVTFLKKHSDAKDVCKALTERIAKGSLQDFEKLKAVYLKHCA
jgi:hypothetical protein